MRNNPHSWTRNIEIGGQMINPPCRCQEMTPPDHFICEVKNVKQHDSLSLFAAA